jgi:sulfonate transport system ATP-binding protein
MAHALHISGLAKSYGSKPVLGPIDLELEPGTITVVIGRSGCGKTTFLRCLGGLEVPTAGLIRIGDGTVRRAEIGYVFQEPRLMPWLTVSRNVSFGLSGRPARARGQAVAEALALVGLPQAGSLLPKQLSGGMAQRVALARALAPGPALILLDEPFSALDPFTREQMQEHLLHLHRHYRTTMVMITHDMDEALTLAHRIILMAGPPGRIACDVAPNLARPAERNAPDFIDCKRRLAGLISKRPEGGGRDHSPHLSGLT